jgi:hypothetical protein
VKGETSMVKTAGTKAKVVVMSFADVVNPVDKKIDFLITIDTTPSM